MPPPTDVLVRRAVPADAEGMAAVLNPIVAARVYSAMVDPVTADGQRAWIEAFPARGVLHVAVDRASGRVVGLQDVAPFWSGSRAFDHVGSIGTFVDLAWHRRGIGARLFAATFDACRAAGYEKIVAFVRADNEAGLRAYRGQGFRDVGVAARHARIDGRDVDEVILERFL